MKVLAGDVGGTNARLALVEVEGNRATILDRKDFPSARYAGLAPIVLEYLATLNEQPENACFGVPCPIDEGSCTLANLNWVLDLAEFQRETRLPRALLINDFAALGHAISFLQPDDLVAISAGTARPMAAMGIIGAGTGLGQGALIWDGTRYRVVASEGGHVDFAPRTEEEIALLRFLLQRYPRVSWERVLSGKGLVNIYEFLIATGYGPELPEVKRQMATRDPAAVISSHGLGFTDPVCRHALDIFVSVYGAQAGNVALVYRARGGVYLAGGIAPRIVPRLLDGAFLTAFRAKGRLTALLERIPVSVILDDRAALWGAAVVALDGAGVGRA